MFHPPDPPSTKCIFVFDESPCNINRLLFVRETPSNLGEVGAEYVNKCQLILVSYVVTFFPQQNDTFGLITRVNNFDKCAVLTFKSLAVTLRTARSNIQKFYMALALR